VAYLEDHLPRHQQPVVVDFSGEVHLLKLMLLSPLADSLAVDQLPKLVASQQLADQAFSEQLKSHLLQQPEDYLVDLGQLRRKIQPLEVESLEEHLPNQRLKQNL
jgi:hypothetical protein